MDMCLKSFIKILISISTFGSFICEVHAIQPKIDFSKSIDERRPASIEVADQFENQLGLVEVEPMAIQVGSTSGVYELMPYKERRSDWSQIFSLGVSFFNLPDYQSSFLNQNFKDIYGSGHQLIEFLYLRKKNYSFFSIGMEIGLGFLSANSVQGVSDETSIQLIPIRLGARVLLDGLYNEPYIVPFIMGGGYVMQYEEKLASAKADGNASVAAYYGGGIAFQLDSLDSRADRVGFEEYGLENSYLYVEAKQFMISSGESDPDFSTDLFWGAGIAIEL